MILCGREGLLHVRESAEEGLAEEGSAEECESR